MYESIFGTYVTTCFVAPWQTLLRLVDEINEYKHIIKALKWQSIQYLNQMLCLSSRIIIC